MPARATTVRTRTRQHSLGLLKGLSGFAGHNVDFLVGESDDLLAAERSMHLQRKRRKAMLAGARSPTCAAVRAEIQTCIRQLVRAWPLEPTSGRGGVYSRFSEIAGRSPRELVGDSEDAFATRVKVRNTRAGSRFRSRLRFRLRLHNYAFASGVRTPLHIRSRPR